jgi:uncharacterized protein (TIGR03437 family)
MRLVCPFLFGALFSSVPAHAQFLGFIAPGHGDELYFWSYLPLKGSGSPQQGRIFKVGASGASVVAEVKAFHQAGICDPCFSNSYNLSLPDVSRDGAVFSYAGQRDCSGFLCIRAGENQSTTITGVPGKGSLTFPGTGRLSGNGRYFIVRYQKSPVDRTPTVELYDLQTGGRVSDLSAQAVYGYTGSSGRPIADDGSVAMTIASNVVVFRDGHAIKGPDVPGPSDPVIDSAGKTVLYQAIAPYYHLRYFHPDTQEEGVFLQANGNVDAPSLTADGKRAAFQSNVKFGSNSDVLGNYQVYMINIDGTNLHAVTADPNGIAQYILSDDGENLWYLSTKGAVYQVTTATGQTVQRVASTCPSTAYLTSPGSAMPLGVGTCPGSNWRVTFDGLAGPIVPGPTNDVWVQTPWEVHTGTAVPIRVESDSPFDLHPDPIEIRPVAPSLGSLIHGDWSGYVSQARPAHPGEALFSYATGLGPVVPAAKTGVPAALDSLALTTTPLNCSIPVLFAGLAPGTIGFYQVVLKVPDGASGTLHVSCGSMSFDVPVAQ